MTYRLVILCHLALSPCSYGLRVFCISFRMGSSVQENQNRADAALASEAHCPVLSSFWSTRVRPRFQRICQLLSMFFCLTRHLCGRGCLQPHAVWRMVLACCPWRVCARLNLQDQVLVTLLYTEGVKRLQDSEFQDVSSRQHPDRYHEQQHNQLSLQSTWDWLMFYWIKQIHLC